MMVVMVAVMMIRNPVVPFWNIAFCLIKFFNSKAHFVAFNSLLYASCTAIIPVIHCPFFLSIKVAKATKIPILIGIKAKEERRNYQANAKF